MTRRENQVGEGSESHCRFWGTSDRKQTRYKGWHNSCLQIFELGECKWELGCCICTVQKQHELGFLATWEHMKMEHLFISPLAEISKSWEPTTRWWLLHLLTTTGFQSLGQPRSRGNRAALISEFWQLLENRHLTTEKRLFCVWLIIARGCLYFYKPPEEVHELPKMSSK